MIKIKILLVSLLFLCGFQIASANIVINEIQILPTNERFVELYNSSDIEIDLTGFYLQRKTSTGSSFTSLISSTNFENKKIKAKDYFVISRNSASYSQIVLSDLTITESNVLQLKNKEGNIVDIVCFGSAICSGVKTDQNPVEGQSLARVDDQLILNTPTPNTVNQNNSENTSNNSEVFTNSNIETTQNSQTENLVKSSNTNSLEVLDLDISSSEIGFAEKKHTFFAQAYLGQNKLLYGKYFWNFGDGNMKIINSGIGEKFEHIYKYPGEYNVSILYFKDPYKEEPDLVKKFKVKIIPLSVVISSVGSEYDFFIELTNKTNNLVDLSNWSLRSINHNFILPKYTTLEPNEKLILAPNTTNFVYADRQYLKLMDSNDKIIFDYGILQTEKLVKKVNNIYSVRSVSDDNFKNFIDTNLVEDFDNIENKNLTSNVLASSNDLGEIKYFGFLFILILLSLFVVYLIKKNKSEFIAGDDFEILE